MSVRIRVLIVLAMCASIGGLALPAHAQDGVELPIDSYFEAVLDEANAQIFVTDGVDTILVIDYDGRVLARISGLPDPLGMTMSPDGADVWVATSDAALRRIDTTTRTVAETFPVEPDQCPQDVAFVGWRLILASACGDRLGWVDLAGDRMYSAHTIDSIPRPLRLASSPSADAFVAGWDGISMYSIDVSGAEPVVHEFWESSALNVVDFAVSPNGSEVTLAAVDRVIHQTLSFPALLPVHTFETPHTGRAVAYSGDGLLLFNGTGKLYDLDVWTFSTAARELVGARDVGHSLHARGLVVNVDGSRVWGFTRAARDGDVVVKEVSSDFEPGQLVGFLEAPAAIPYGGVEVFSEAEEHMGAAELNEFGYFEITVPAGLYYVLGYSADDTTWYDYFPEWYDDQPWFRPEAATLVEVPMGRPSSAITVELNWMFHDMFGSTFIDDIFWLRNTGITLGCGNDLFCPDDPVTRGQMAAFLARGLYLEERGTYSFSDDDTSAFEADIEKLAEAGITRGCSGTNPALFCPDNVVTRGQMAAFIVRALDLTARGTFTFTDDDGSTFEADIEKLAEAGITLGCSASDPNLFCPNQPVTRGQMAAFLHRALGGVLYPESVGPRLAPQPESRRISSTID